MNRAIAYYQKKYGQTPDLCFVHPSMLPDRNPIRSRGGCTSRSDDPAKSFLDWGKASFVPCPFDRVTTLIFRVVFLISLFNFFDSNQKIDVNVGKGFERIFGIMSGGDLKADFSMLFLSHIPAVFNDPQIQISFGPLRKFF